MAQARTADLGGQLIEARVDRADRLRDTQVARWLCCGICCQPQCTLLCSQELRLSRGKCTP